MFTIKIGTERRTARELKESWVNKQVNRRRREGRNVCVRVAVHEIVIPSCGCPQSGRPGKRTLSRKQEAIRELWRKHGLHECDFTGGQVNAFLKQLRTLL